MRVVSTIRETREAVAAARAGQIRRGAPANLELEGSNKATYIAIQEGLAGLIRFHILSEEDVEREDYEQDSPIATAVRD